MVTLHIYLSRDIKFSIPPYHVSLKNKNCMKENKFFFLKTTLYIYIYICLDESQRFRNHEWLQCFTINYHNHNWDPMTTFTRNCHEFDNWIWLTLSTSRDQKKSITIPNDSGNHFWQQYIYVAIRFYDTDWALSGPGNNWDPMTTSTS